MADIAACLSTGKDSWETPDEFFKNLDDRYRFVLDAAADRVNHKCPDYLGPGGLVEDALACSWERWLKEGNVWLNPPYSRGLQAKFVMKAKEEAFRSRHSVVCLLPARTDTRLFHDVILSWAEIEFIKGRLRFKGAPASAPFPSMLVTFTGTVGEVTRYVDWHSAKCKKFTRGSRS